MNRQNSIRLHIERLVVDEPLIAAGQGAALQAVIETELSRLLAAGGLMPSPDTFAATLNAGNVSVSGKSALASFGRRIAQSIYSTLQAPGSAANTENRPSNRSSR